MSRFRILSLDGGGIRGAFSAAFLAEVEKQTGAPIHEHFDLIAGTSTGGIIALAIALGEPADRVVDFYRDDGPRVFTRRRTKTRLLSTPLRWLINRGLRRYAITLDDLICSRYDSTELRKALDRFFGGRTLLDAKTRAVIPAVDLSRGGPVIFKTPHLAEARTRDKDLSIVDIALATSAAPTYFPAASTGPGTAYCDGGLWANNPVVVAITESQRLNAADRPALTDVEVLSIGTGQPCLSVIPPADCGLEWWLPNLFDISGLAQSEGCEKISEFLLPERVERVNFTLPNRSWKLDSVDKLDQLIHFGRDAAHQRLPALRHRFFTGVAGQISW